jgi:hypothetical protein
MISIHAVKRERLVLTNGFVERCLALHRLPASDQWRSQRSRGMFFAVGLVGFRHLHS